MDMTVEPIEDVMEDNDTWLCPRCSALIESIFHCPTCKVQPPWGCDCADCQYGDDDEDDDDFDGYEVEDNPYLDRNESEVLPFGEPLDDDEWDAFDQFFYDYTMRDL